jgi:hypothetical protein
LATPRWHGHWIEVEGTVRDLTRIGTLNILVAAGENRFEVIAPYSQRWLPSFDLLEARISVRGLCEIPVDFYGRPTQPRLLLNDTNSIRIVHSGTTNTFGRTFTGPDDYRRNAPSDERIKIAGTVLFQSAGGASSCAMGREPFKQSNSSRCHCAPLASSLSRVRRWSHCNGETESSWSAHPRLRRSRRASSMRNIVAWQVDLRPSRFASRRPKLHRESAMPIWSHSGRGSWGVRHGARIGWSRKRCCWRVTELFLKR